MNLQFARTHQPARGLWHMPLAFSAASRASDSDFAFGLQLQPLYFLSPSVSGFTGGGIEEPPVTKSLA